ncbi:MAG: dockerin type I repeat-containing protein, partial [Oscillospiraceae bacterium]|nr:dockerin type I repeat-containing protein [Oscillospiraceae bacterium]
AADGSIIATMYMNVADKDTVVAAAESLGLELKSDADKGSYYAFPLNFDPSIDPEKGSSKCEAVNTKEEATEINFVNGFSNIVVGDVVVTTTTEPDETTTTTTTTTTATTTAKTTTTTTATTTAEPDDVTTTTTTGDKNWNDLIGDTNLYGKIGILDIIRLNKYIIGSTDLSEQALRNAACKDDGVIDINDLTSLMRYLVNLIDALPEA